jgi:LPXTG-site transpeptidase (sortase) family protein
MQSISAIEAAAAKDPRPRRRPRPRGPVVDRQAARPTSIEIPAVGIAGPVVPLGLNDDGTLEVPDDFGATGWYERGPEPGEAGPAVITGHVDSTTGPAVFYRLRELQSGDEIAVHRADHTTVRFVVERIEEWPKASFPTDRVYGRTRGSVLRLVTCSGEFDESIGHYVDNTIVYADRER